MTMINIKGGYTMEKTYEGKITGEIRRTLRNLEEACAEQQITMEEALEWYVANKAKTEVAFEEPVFAKQENSYREKAELFVSKYVENQEQKAICVVVLCYLSQYEKCPNLDLILKEFDKYTYETRYQALIPFLLSLFYFLFYVALDIVANFNFIKVFYTNTTLATGRNLFNFIFIVF